MKGAAAAEWWQWFFHGGWADVQALVHDEEFTRAQAESVIRLLGLAEGAEVLDVPCGNGRLTLELAARGHRLTGIDQTSDFLVEARRRAGERGLEVEWVEGDVRDLPWSERFDAVVCVWGSFGYFDDGGNLDFARAVAAALEPTGVFLLETHVAETILPRFRERDWRRFGATLLLEETRYDHESGRIETDWTFVNEGNTSTSRSSIRLYSYRELVALVREAGLEPSGAYDSRTEEPFEVGATRLTLLATRQR